MIKWKPQKTKNPHWQAMPLTSENTFATRFLLFILVYFLSFLFAFFRSSSIKKSPKRPNLLGPKKSRTQDLSPFYEELQKMKTIFCTNHTSETRGNTFATCSLAKRKHRHAKTVTKLFDRAHFLYRAVQSERSVLEYEDCYEKCTEKETNTAASAKIRPCLLSRLGPAQGKERTATAKKKKSHVGKEVERHLPASATPATLATLGTSGVG